MDWACGPPWAAKQQLICGLIGLISILASQFVNCSLLPSPALIQINLYSFQDLERISNKSKFGIERKLNFILKRFVFGYRDNEVQGNGRYINLSFQCIIDNQRLRPQHLWVLYSIRDMEWPKKWVKTIPRLIYK